MRKRICDHSRQGSSSPANARVFLAAGVGLLIGSLALAVGCGESSTGLPAEEDGLIEAPIEDDSGQGTHELTSKRKIE